MRVRCKTEALVASKSDVLIVGVFQKKAGRGLKLPDDSLREFVADILNTGDFDGACGQTALVYTHKKIAATRLLLVGLGEQKKFDLFVLRRAVGEAVVRVKGLKVKRAAFALASCNVSGLALAAVAQAVVETFILGSYQYREFKQADKGVKPLAEVVLVTATQKELVAAKAGAGRGRIIAEAANFSRDLQNRPGNMLTPVKLAAAARRMAKAAGLKCRVLGLREIEELKMGAFLGVARGSSEPPRLIIMEHNARKKNLETIVLVGKGITFDSGGISLKPSDRMDEMKFDMSGAAAVLGAMQAAAELKLPFHIVALVPAAENLPGSTSMKPGDILTVSDGTTIEVGNTDAEGRLVLADALVYARKFKPAAVIDLATLTGACVIALGYHATGLLGNDQKLLDQIKQAGEQSCERVWQLPLWDDYYEDIKGDYADIKNSAGRPAGAITAGAFLGTFTKDYPWVHLDIAGTAWLTQKKGCMEKGGTGVGVRLLIQFLQRRAGN